MPGAKSSRCEEHGNFRCVWCVMKGLDPLPPATYTVKSVNGHNNFCWLEHEGCEAYCRAGHLRQKETTQFAIGRNGKKRQYCMICRNISKAAARMAAKSL